MDQAATASGAFIWSVTRPVPTGTAVASDGAAGVYVGWHSGADAYLSHYRYDAKPLWEKHYTDGDADGFLRIKSIDTDSSGNLILVVVGRNLIDFGCGAVDDAPNDYTFLVKLDTGGNCIWVQTFPASGEFQKTSLSVATYGDTITVAGQFTGELDLDGATLTSHGWPAIPSQDIFLARLRADGSVIEATRWGQPPPSDGVNDSGYHLQEMADVGMDSHGNIVFTGTLAQTLDFGAFTLDGADGHMFVIKRRLGGAWVFHRQANADPIAIAVRPSGVFAVTGTFAAGTVDFGNTSVSETGSSIDGFVVKYDAFGSDQWSRHLWGSGQIFPNGLAIDGSGHVVVAGTFYQGSLHIGETSATTVNEHAFVASFGPTTGSLRWSRFLGEDDEAIVLGDAVATTTNDRVMLTGTFSGSVDFGDGNAAPIAEGGYVVRYYP